MFVAGLAFGVISIFVHGFNPFAPWLLMAYPLFVAGLVVGNFVTGAWAARVTKAAGADDASPAGLEAIVTERSARIGIFAFWILVAAIIFVMVVKPLS